MFKTSLTVADPFIAQSIEKAAKRQSGQIELIASENTVSKVAVIKAQAGIGATVSARCADFPIY